MGLDRLVSHGTAALTGLLTTGGIGQTAALKLVWDMAKAAGVVGDAVGAWAPGVRDLLPDFPFLSSGPLGTPPTEGEFSNPLLRDLNGNPYVLDEAVPGELRFFHSTDVETLDGVRYVIGNAVETQRSTSGDGTVLVQSARLEDGLFVTGSYPYPGVKHVGLLADPGVQGDVLATFGVSVPAGFQPTPPVGVLSGGGLVPLYNVPRYLLGFADPVDFVITDASGRQVGSTAAGGYVNQIPGAFYSGEGEFEYVFIPLADEAGDVRVELIGVPGNDYQGEITYVEGTASLVREFSGTLATGQSTSLVVESPAVQPVIGLQPVQVVEGDVAGAAAGFTVTLTEAAPDDVSVAYATSDGTANAGADYTGVSGMLTIPAGQTSAAVQVPLIGDTVLEGNETFYLTLTGPLGALLAEEGVAAATIDDDDPGPDLAVAVVPGPARSTGKGTATVRVTNQGQLPVDGLVDVFLYASRGAVPSPVDPIPGQFHKRLKLKPGAGKSLKFSFLNPDFQDDYYLAATVDEGQLLLESDETNNSAAVAVTAQFVDLQGSIQASLPATVAVGVRSTASLLVRNAGTGLASGSAALSLFASSDNIFDEADVLLTTYTARLKLKPGASRTSKASFVMPPGVSDVRHLILFIDQSAQVTERDESNNIVVL